MVHEKSALTPIEIETERLVLRMWHSDDFVPFATMCADPKVMQFIGSGAVMTSGQVAVDIESYKNYWQIKGYGQFALIHKSTQKFIGFAGLGDHVLLPQYHSCAEIGWRLAQEFWGQGYAIEAAKAVLDFGIRHHQLFDIVSVCQTGNLSSERIMQKIGMIFEGETIAPNNGRAINIYRLITAPPASLQTQ